MDLTNLTPSTLRELLKLTEQKASLQDQLASIDSRITALSTGKAAPAKAATGKRRGRPAKASKAPVAAPKAKRGRPAKAKAAAPAAKPAAPKAPKAKRGKRGALKNDILKLLSDAGPAGITVKDISDRLGVKNQNVHVWFSTTGKKLPGLSKVGEARYALN